ncbi:MAG: CsbD family protein [Actinomycetota bacterium]|nr:CsbD family protein [Actinomycetota bacterium]
MSFLDKLSGRAKKAAADLTGDGALHKRGRREERKGEAKEELTRDQERADAKAEEVSNLERKT